MVVMQCVSDRIGSGCGGGRSGGRFPVSTLCNLCTGSSIALISGPLNLLLCCRGRGGG